MLVVFKKHAIAVSTVFQVRVERLTWLFMYLPLIADNITTTTATTTILFRPFVRDYLLSCYQKKHSPTHVSWSLSNLYQLLPSTTIHSIFLVQIPCLAIFVHNLSPSPLWSTSSSVAFHLIFHTFLHPISVFFSKHMRIPSQPVLL